MLRLKDTFSGGLGVWVRLILDTVMMFMPSVLRNETPSLLGNFPFHHYAVFRLQLYL